MYSMMIVYYLFYLTLLVSAPGVLPSPVNVAVRPRDLQVVYAPESRIVSGNRATDGMFPHQVALFFNTWFCGGSIIGNEWIVTAAHCAIDAKYVDIYMGSSNINKPQLMRYSDNFYVHPYYNPINMGDNIALVQMHPIEFTININKIPLPSLDTSDDFAGEIGVASGFGLISEGITSHSDALTYINLNIISNEECKKFYGPIVVNPHVICTTTSNGWSTCAGDSGGPLTTTSASPILIAVTSFGPCMDKESNYPSGFVRVTSYLKWINEITGISY